jgi:preprotein translocase subunit SecE
MASATENGEKTMATDVMVPGANEPGDRRPPQPQQRAESAGGHGFFTIYKKGQGYWTRIGTAIGAGVIIATTGWFLYRFLPPNIPSLQNPPGASDIPFHLNRHNWLLGIVTAVVGLMTLIAWRLMNKPDNADFLIATDSEMKKVNWTTRKDLIGSTKVVIGFMFLIAMVLFLVDQYFTRMFYNIGILAGDAPLWSAIPSRAGRIAVDVVSSAIIIGGAAWAIWGTARSKA